MQINSANILDVTYFAIRILLLIPMIGITTWLVEVRKKDYVKLWGNRTRNAWSRALVVSVACFIFLGTTFAVDSFVIDYFGDKHGFVYAGLTIILALLTFLAGTMREIVKLRSDNVSSMQGSLIE